MQLLEVASMSINSPFRLSNSQQPFSNKFEAWCAVITMADQTEASAVLNCIDLSNPDIHHSASLIKQVYSIVN